MLKGNGTAITDFILLGLTDNKDLDKPLFVFFLFVYIITLLGNLTILTLICISPRLHTPMYFLLSNLSFIDVCYSSTIAPNMLANFLSSTKKISFLGCATQFFFYAVLANTDALMLAVMAYDRYAAICHPLSYAVIMTKRVCACLVAGSYTASFLAALAHTSLTFRLSFCGSNEISQFFCDIPPLLKLSCSDTTPNVIVLYTVAGSMQVGSLLAVLISYAYIIFAITRIRSTDGKRRAASTCASHITCVIMFYSPVLFMYLRPQSSYSLDHDRVASVFYAVVIPMLNPLVYSLRNKEVKNAAEKVMGRKS